MLKCNDSDALIWYLLNQAIINLHVKIYNNEIQNACSFEFKRFGFGCIGHIMQLWIVFNKKERKTEKTERN